MHRFVTTVTLGLMMGLAWLCGASFGPQDDKSLKDELPRIPATEPTDAIKTFKLIDGMKIELVAGEPLVTSPVDMAFDEDGRLWVCEMNDYPFGPAEGNPPQGRVKVLDDDDGDGRMDRATVLVDKLAWPTGLALWDGGCFVCAAPDIFYFKDTDGDGAADVREVVFTGFGKQNVQALLNNIKWGIDNWFYGASGPNGGTIKSNRKPDSSPLNVGGRDFRFRPTGEIEPVSGGAQFGHSMDDFGRRFVCSNSAQARHVVLENRYLARNPALPVAAVIHSIASDGDQGPVYRRSAAEPWRIVRTRLRVAGQVPGPIEFGGKVTGYFTSATGITVYRGTALGDDFYGNLFIGDVASNLVHRKTMRPDGVTFVADRAEKEHEFLATTDTWFRPCNFANGPDGALYICDIYREVVEHPASIPEIIKKHLDLTSGKDRGRIWRVTRDGAAPYTKPQLGKASTGDLVESLRRRDGWWRETAARLLFQRQDRKAAPLLERLLTGDHPEVRVAAMWAMEGLGALREDHLLPVLRNGNEPSEVVEHAIRLAEPRAAGSEAIRRALCNSSFPAGHWSPRVRMQLAYTLGEFDDEQRLYTLARIGWRDSADPWTRAAILSSLAKISAGADQPSDAFRLIRYLDKDPEERLSIHSSMWGDLARLAAASKNRQEIVSLLKEDVAPPAQGKVRDDRRWAILRGLADGMARSGQSLGQWLEKPTAELESVSDAIARIFDQVATAAADTSRQDGARVEAIQLLSQAPREQAIKVLVDLLNPRQPQPVQLAAVRTLSAYSDARVAPLLLAPWKAYTPPVRREALEALLSRADRVLALLDALETGAVRRGDIEVDRRAQLIQHRDEKIRERAKKLLGSATSEDRGKVIAKYRPALDGSVSADRGKEVFKKTCSTCHRFNSEGTEVGPDLRTVQERTPDQLLEQILDPGREVNPAYINYTLATTDGRILTGIIAGESATSVTLKRAEGATDVILRADIDEMISTGLSIMPEGLEKDITPEQLADVIAYIRRR